MYFHICVHTYMHCLNCIALATHDEESICHVHFEANSDDVSEKDEYYAPEESAENTTEIKKMQFMKQVVSEPCTDDVSTVFRKYEDYAVIKREQLVVKSRERQFKTLELETSNIVTLELERSWIEMLELTSELVNSKMKLLDEEEIESK